MMLQYVSVHGSSRPSGWPGTHDWHAGRGSTRLLLLCNHCNVHERLCQQKLPPRPGLLHLQAVPSSLRWHPTQHALAPSFRHGAAIPRKSSAISFRRRAKFLFNQTRPARACTWALFPRSFPVLKRTCTVDAPPHPAVSSFLSVSPTFSAAKAYYGMPTVSYIRLPLRQGMDIRICTAQNRRWLPYVWEPPSQVQRVNQLTLPLSVTSVVRYTSYKHATSASSLP
ncbi:hypothetical protein JMJ77_0008463 [Colletotrichum scovillei]|uniref:Uncharacterized protein n=1 Tax=Colletotrichum scovillei TaxID=1209932 RepID=A0A9P7RE84_9PEZI|nr:hypothetical protein JMJ77_0008463 [Colletotrichum scovillei]KAG7075457.1 hypothetical protein JMJ76_0011917 [Colletotrichum scovillei]KAG7082540.1 hypothetical protein JMJ78_0004641 [Colletotrichum scovillei]